MAEKYFDIKRDVETIEQGGFWCSCCLTGKQADDKSPDPRYCQSCYDGLVKDIEALGTSARQAAWWPKPIPECDKLVASSQRRIQNLSQDTKPGPQRKELPEKVILDLANQGLSSYAIAATLLEKHNTDISARTIQAPVTEASRAYIKSN